jgi:hypothetical protein
MASRNNISDSKIRLIAISTIFNIYWVCAVYFKDAAVPALLLVYLLAVYRDRKLMAYSLLIAIVGLTIDSLLTYIGLFKFKEEDIPLFLADISFLPMWLYFLWLGFSCYAWSLRQLVVDKNKYVVSVIVSFAATTSYIAAEKLQAVSIQGGLYSIALILVIWFVFSISILWLMRKARNINVDDSTVSI